MLLILLIITIILIIIMIIIIIIITSYMYIHIHIYIYTYIHALQGNTLAQRSKRGTACNKLTRCSIRLVQYRKGNKTD